MSRTKLVIAMVGVTMAAGAAGCALGMLAAPASGKELRRRLAWRAEEQCRGAARASRDFIRRAFDRAVAELESRRKGVTV
jgi:gas vesicle protein